jgi:hypothetical protein
VVSPTVVSFQNQAANIEYDTHYTTEIPRRDLLPQHSQGMHKAGPRSYSIETTSDIVRKR